MKKTDEIVDKKASNASSWQKRPSEIKGYKVCYYLTDKKKDYIRVDVNPKGKKVRLYIEVFKQGGCPYFSAIADGKIITEKNLLTKRSFGFSNVFSERASLVSTIPDEDVIELFAGNYGIESSGFLKTKEDEKKKLLKETKKMYFTREVSDEGSLSGMYGDEKGSFLKAILWRSIDIFFGAALSVSFFFIFGYSFTALGACAAFYGIILGAIDLFIRERSPNVFKLLLFLAAGFVSYVYGYYII